MNTFDPTKPVQTRDGRKVEIKSTSMQGAFTIIGYIEGNSAPKSWKPDGRFFEINQASCDLINIPAEPKLRAWTGVEAIEHFGRKVRSKDKSIVCIEIAGVAANGEIFVNGKWFESKHLLNAYEFLDGKPCGVEAAQ